MRPTTTTLAVLLVSLICSSVSAQTVWRVDDDAPLGGDGLSWSTAFAYVQDALAAAQAGDEVRVAGGMYMPDQDEGSNVTSGDRAATFQLVDGVAIYGGYAGLANPGDPGARDVEFYESTLSGDLAGDDLPDFVNYGENAYRVVSADFGVNGSAILDGFTITAGNADVAPWDRGAGVYIDTGSPQILGCLITLSISADVFMGGTGVYVQGASQAELRDCQITQNAGYFAVSVASGAAPLLEDCTISENTAGALMFAGGGNGTVRRCVITDNTHSDGDAAFWFIHTNSSPLIESCTIERNVGQSASTCHHGASPTIAHCAIRSNEATASPGGFINIQYDASAPIIHNCLIVDNAASGDGGAIRCGPDAAPSISSCTLVQNTTAGAGGGVACAGGLPTMTDCILWENSPDAISESSGTITVSYSDVEGGWSGTGGNNTDIDPSFVLGPDGFHYLSQTSAGQTQQSPCVDAGSDTAVNLGLGALTTRMDEVGDAGVADMGYHYPVTGSVVMHVDDDAPLGGDGTTWSTAYRYLQDALDACTNGDVIAVANGTYTPDQDEGGNVTQGDRAATFQLVNGVAIYGGYAGLANPGDPDVRDINLYESALSGDLAGDDLPDFINYGENAYRVVSASSGVDGCAILDGFTVTAGNANVVPWDKGAGIYIDTGSPQILGCRVTKNTSADVFMGGTGAYVLGASQAELRGCQITQNAGYFAVSVAFGAAPLLEDCTISGNTAGALMFSAGGHGTVRRCVVSDNTHSDGDTAFWFIHANSSPLIESCTIERNVGQSVSTCHHGASPTIAHCTIRSNEAMASPGGFINIQYDASAPIIQNCLIINNTANGDGGAIRCGPDATPAISSCTLVQNTTAGDGGGIACAGGSQVVSDCIIWGNSPNAIYDSGGTATVSYSAVEGGWTGSGNIDTDPLFTGGPLGCYYLGHTATGHPVDSPCVDAGSDTAVSLGLDTLTTRRDEVADTGVGDMGYHHPVGEEPAGPDCNSNGVPDDCDLQYCDGSPWCSDCNTDGILDECNIASGASQDLNGNGVPDECDPLLVNGSFESGPAFGGCYLPVDPGSTAIDGWVVVDGQIDIVTPCWGAPPDGVRFIDLNGTCDVGAIQQTIATTPGDTYSVSFDFADHIDIPYRMRVEAASQYADFVSDAMPPGSQSWQEYETITWRFTALGDETVLKFASQNLEPELACTGPGLDNVSLVRIECEEPMAGDIDCDGDVDLADYAAFAECMAGPGMFPAPAPPWSPYECLSTFDADVDDDVDMHDFAGLQQMFGQ